MHSKTILARILRYAAPHWRLGFSTLLVTLIGIGADLVVPALLREVIDSGIENRNQSVLITMAILIVSFTTLKGLAQFGRQFMAEVLSQRVVFTLRNQLYDHIQSLSFQFHDNTRTGELMSRTTSDVERVRRFAAMGIFQMTQIIILTVSIAIVLLITEWQLALLSLMVVPVLTYIAVVFAQRIRPLHQLVQEAWADLNVVVQENLAGSRVVRAFAQEHAEMERFGPVNAVLNDRTVGTMRMFAMRAPLFTAVLGAGQVSVLWFGGWKVIDGQTTIGTLVAFNTYLLLMMMPIRMLGLTINSFARAIASGERIFDVLDEESTVQESPAAQPLRNPQGTLTFEDVSFRHDDDYVLQNISFNIEAGQSLGIVGATGSGKSSIINLLPRFYDTTKGRVLFDDQDILDLRIDALRAQIGIVHQEPFVFATSIRENVAYGRPNATRMQVIAAAKLAQIHDFIETLPSGYETIVGERGVTLSGGQKQRLAIARALVLNPRVLILDESTSSVDTWTERAIQDALREAQRHRTTLIISQRIRSVQHANEIIVLEQGHISQRGNHETLINGTGLYRDMWLTQEAEAERLRRDANTPAAASAEES
jgi:ABC-type multidrug transport system fused ATPase/permease subunit